MGKAETERTLAVERQRLRVETETQIAEIERKAKEQSEKLSTTAREEAEKNAVDLKALRQQILDGLTDDFEAACAQLKENQDGETKAMIAKIQKELDAGNDASETIELIEKDVIHLKKTVQARLSERN